MKAILVLNDIHDIPKNCMSCPLIEYHHEYSIICRHYQTGDTRPTWCPLRPLPEKMPMRDEAEFYLVYMNGKTKYLGFNEGYNACLEDILGGE